MAHLSRRVEKVTVSVQIMRDFPVSVSSLMQFKSFHNLLFFPVVLSLFLSFQAFKITGRADRKNLTGFLQREVFYFIFSDKLVKSFSVFLLKKKAVAFLSISTMAFSSASSFLSRLTST